MIPVMGGLHAADKVPLFALGISRAIGITSPALDTGGTLRGLSTAVISSADAKPRVLRCARTVGWPQTPRLLVVPGEAVKRT